MATEVATQATSAGNGEQAVMNAAAATTIRPLVDIFETADGITLRADMPGVSKDGLNLRVEGANLLVEGKIGIVPEEKMSALHADIRSTLYRRSFVLGSANTMRGASSRCAARCCRGSCTGLKCRGSPPTTRSSR